MRDLKTKSFFSFFFLLLTVQLIIVAITPSGFAYDPETVVIKSNWLYIDTGDFIDSSPHSWENNLVVTSGGEDLLDFKNLGIISASNDEILYKAEATFGFEITAHTSVGVLDAFPELNTEAEKEVAFLDYSKINWLGIRYAHYRYSTRWHYADLGQLYQHDYSGLIPVTVGIKPLSSTSGDITINGNTFNIPTYISNTLQVHVADLNSKEIGNYTSEYKNVADSQEVTVSFTNMDDTSNVVDKVLDYLESHQIGIDATRDPEPGPQLQQSKVDGSQPGATFHNPNPIDNNYYTFNLYTSLAPEVRKDIQTIKVTQVAIGYYDPTLFSDAYIEVAWGPYTLDQRRTVGVHTQNYVLHWDFMVDVEFLATIPSNAELTESVLSDPYLKMGDWVWDTSIMGGNLAFTVDSTSFWERLASGLQGLFSSIWGIILMIVLIILVFVGLYLFIRVGVPLIVRRSKRK